MDGFICWIDAVGGQMLDGQVDVQMDGQTGERLDGWVDRQRDMWMNA